MNLDGVRFLIEGGPAAVVTILSFFQHLAGEGNEVSNVSFRHLSVLLHKSD